MKSSHRNRAWISLISWLWNVIHSNKKHEDVDEGLYWLDPIACHSMLNHHPPKAPNVRDDFLTKLTALCDALRFYAPNNPEVDTLLHQLIALKNEIHRMEKHQKQFCETVLLDTYQLLVEEQTDFLEHVQNCRDEVKKIKKSLPEEWLNSLHEYFLVFEKQPISIHKKHMH